MANDVDDNSEHDEQQKAQAIIDDEGENLRKALNSERSEQQAQLQCHSSQTKGMKWTVVNQ